MQNHLHADRALARYFQEKQFAMGQRFVRDRIVAALTRRGLAAQAVEKAVQEWEETGLIREHSDSTISLTPAAYPKLTN